MQTNQNDNEWFYNSAEYYYLNSNNNKGITFKTFDEFWTEFNKNSFIAVAVGDEASSEDFKIRLKNNAIEIYDAFTKGLNNA